MSHLIATGETCDKCHVASAQTLYLTEDHELTFCGHHDREVKDALLAQGFERFELVLPDVRDAQPSPLPG